MWVWCKYKYLEEFYSVDEYFVDYKLEYSSDGLNLYYTQTKTKSFVNQICKSEFITIPLSFASRLLVDVLFDLVIIIAELIGFSLRVEE